METIYESIRKDAEQIYGKEQVDAIIMRDKVLAMKYLIPICKFVYQEGLVIGNLV